MANLYIKKSLVCYKTVLDESELAWKIIADNSADTMNLNDETNCELVYSDGVFVKLMVTRCYNKKCSAQIYYSEDVVMKKCSACLFLNCMECSVSCILNMHLSY